MKKPKTRFVILPAIPESEIKLREVPPKETEYRNKILAEIKEILSSPGFVYNRADEELKRRSTK